jgi:integrase
VRSRILADAEFLTLWRALEVEGDPALACFMTLAFTGCRRREATQMRWAELDLERATWALPPERRKTGARDPEPFVINLHADVVEALRRQAVLDGSPYVFWGRRQARNRMAIHPRGLVGDSAPAHVKQVSAFYELAS